jgi:sugar phosphate permease
VIRESVPITENNVTRYLYIAVLVVAGEMVFGLPFHTARFFRPTVLEVFGLSNTQLGYVFAIYGAVAMASYFPGGALADRFSGRALLCASLFATGLGGLYMATLPGFVGVSVVYGFWGFTTIFLLWGALIRTTREWGGQSSQGMAFGTLEAGRGVVAAVFATLAVTALATVMPDDAAQASEAERQAGLRTIYLIYSAAAFGAGALAWFALPAASGSATTRHNPFPNMLVVIRRPIVWAQAAVIVCAYSCFKATDFYSQYAVIALGMDEVEGARLASYGAYLRPVAAIVAGVVADRVNATRAIGVIFLLLALVYIVLSASLPDTTSVVIIYANLVISLFAVFSLRGIYFALLQETRTPRSITGAAVGMISFVGFTPEIFLAWIAGVILDAAPGVPGFLNLFRFLAITAGCGILVVWWLLTLKRRQRG